MSRLNIAWLAPMPKTKSSTWDIEDFQLALLKALYLDYKIDVFTDHYIVMPHHERALPIGVGLYPYAELLTRQTRYDGFYLGWGGAPVVQRGQYLAFLRLITAGVNMRAVLHDCLAWPLTRVFQDALTIAAINEAFWQSVFHLDLPVTSPDDILGMTGKLLLHDKTVTVDRQTFHIALDELSLTAKAIEQYRMLLNSLHRA